MRLYPRLRLLAARNLAATAGELDIEELARRSSLEHDEAAPAATGGQAASSSDLERLRRAIRDEATRSGYPEPANLRGQQEFDARVGRLLVEQMEISANEATHVEMWAFLGCVLLPDVVRWRFPGRTATPEERFIGGARGLRNAFGRLWWRAYLLEARRGEDGLLDPLVALNEDEMVQITERPGLSGYPATASALAHAFQANLGQTPPVPREALMRESAKRLMRTLALVAPETLDQDELNSLVTEAIEGARRALLLPDAPTDRTGPTSRPPATTSESPGGPPLADTQNAGHRFPEDAPAQDNIRPAGRPPVREDPLLQELRARELEVVDLRERRGRLWVVGGRELESDLASFAPPDARFIFSPNGASSTGHRPAWYLFHRTGS